MRTIIFCFFLGFFISGCGGAGDELAPGRYELAMTFQGAELAGAADVAGGGRGTWSASNPENAYAGDLVDAGDGAVDFWFGQAGSGAFELRTVDGRSIDPAIAATIELTPAR